MFMMMFVSKDEVQASEVLDVWIKAGIGGVTILESSGMSQIHGGLRDDVGIIFSLRSMLRAKEVHHRTLMSAVDSQETVDKVVQATTAHVGDWSKPDVGILLVWPLAQALGLEKHFPKRGSGD
jgi:nitrogen regulatory protein PII